MPVAGAVVAEMMLESGIKVVAESVPVALTVFVVGPELVSVAVAGVVTGAVVLATTSGVGVGVMVAELIGVVALVIAGVAEVVPLLTVSGDGVAEAVGVTTVGLTVALAVALTVALSVGLTVTEPVGDAVAELVTGASGVDVLAVAEVMTEFAELT